MKIDETGYYYQNDLGCFKHFVDRNTNITDEFKRELSLYVGFFQSRLKHELETEEESLQAQIDELKKRINLLESSHRVYGNGSFKLTGRELLAKYEHNATKRQRDILRD